MPDEPLTVTLRAAHAGDRDAANRAYAALYPELLKIARARLRAHQPNTLLDTQALVHESFMRFVEAEKIGIGDRKHFFTYAAKTMRNIVIDFARRRQAERRGGAAERLELAQVVEMRYFGGYTDAEIAAAMDIADRTVRRHWDKARAFILAQLQP